MMTLAERSTSVITGGADLRRVVADPAEFLAAKSALIKALTEAELNEDQLAFI